MTYFVTMTDRFMSGWGLARGKANKLVIECDTYAQAEQVERAAKRRTEMRRVNIRTTKPYYKGAHVLVSWKHFSDLGGPWLE
jgi:hypothetical protein